MIHLNPSTKSTQGHPDPAHSPYPPYPRHIERTKKAESLGDHLKFV